MWSNAHDSVEKNEEAYKPLLVCQSAEWQRSKKKQLKSKSEIRVAHVVQQANRLQTRSIHNRYIL